MDIDYGVYGVLIDHGIKERLKFRSHVLGNNNAYPVLDSPLHEGNFEQRAAKKRFSDLIVKYQDLNNCRDTNVSDLAMFIQRHFMNDSFKSIFQIGDLERPHLNKLENIAIDIISNDFNIKKGDVIFNAKIMGYGNVALPDNMASNKEETSEPPEITDENLEYDVEDEVQKRQFINALISGASKKGHYIFHLAKPMLDEIDANLIPLYQRLMVNNDLSYYLIGDQYAKAISESDSNSNNAGFEKITFADDGTPIITVEAVNFPTLIHELIKGVLELIATLALPDDKPLLDYIYDSSDYIDAEIWYLRLGPVYWEKLVSCIPPEHAPIKAQLLGKLFSLETDDFNDVMKSILSDNNQEDGKAFFSSWGSIIKENIRRYNQDNM